MLNTFHVFMSQPARVVLSLFHALLSFPFPCLFPAPPFLDLIPLTWLTKGPPTLIPIFFTISAFPEEKLTSLACTFIPLLTLLSVSQQIIIIITSGQATFCILIWLLCAVKTSVEDGINDPKSRVKLGKSEVTLSASCVRVYWLSFIHILSYGNEWTASCCDAVRIYTFLLWNISPMPLKLKQESSEVEAECLQTAAETENTQEFGPPFVQPWTLTYISTWGRVWRPYVMYLTRYRSPFSSSLPPSSLPGIDFKVKTIDVDGKKVKLQVW